MRIGIDLGGTKIEGIALGDEGAELARHRIPTPGSYAATLQAIVSVVARLEHETGERGTVGIGTPGAISPATGLIKNANSTALNGRPLDRDLSAVLGREVRLANDANCFALSEAVDGSGAGYATVFGVILGTGVGGGIVVGGRILDGPNAIGGEWGHNTLPWPSPEEWPGPPCYCGRTGCIETFLSGPGFARDHNEATGLALDARQIEAAAVAGEAEAEAAFQRYEERLARGLAGVINILDPAAIVLGGGMSNLARFYESVPRLWQPRVFSDRVDTALLPPRHGDSSGVRGAAWLWE
ncbi:MAG: ROK family protein [Dehalococcoidia bacterium]